MIETEREFRRNGRARVITLCGAQKSRTLKIDFTIFSGDGPLSRSARRFLNTFLVVTPCGVIFTSWDSFVVRFFFATAHWVPRVLRGIYVAHGKSEPLSDMVGSRVRSPSNNFLETHNLIFVAFLCVIHSHDRTRATRWCRCRSVRAAKRRSKK